MSVISAEARVLDTISTRAYWIGYIEGRLSTRRDFTIDIPTSNIEGILTLLSKHPIDVDIGQPRIGKFTVSWTTISVRLP